MNATAASKELEEIINFAIEREEESMHFYEDLALKVKSPPVVREIRKLATMEKRHRNRLAKINIATYVGRLREQAAIPHLAEYMVNEKPNSKMSLQELINIAMHREQAAVALYSDLSKLFAGPSRRLFEHLAAEECNHAQIFAGK